MNISSITRASRASARYLVCALYCLSAGTAVPQAVSIKLSVQPPEVIAQRLQRLHPDNAQREVELKSMFEEVGCAQPQEQIVRRKDPPNVICTLPGTTDSLIIVGAHLDHVEQGTGAIDDWSGASLLPSLYATLKDTPRNHTFVFIGFTDEEIGLVGSDFYLKHFPKAKLASIKAIVNLECLGLTHPKVWNNAADPQLLRDLFSVARSMGVDLQGVNIEEVGDDDTHAFRDKRIPSVTVHSVTQATWPLLHTKNDNLEAVHVDDLYESYRLIAVYLAYIDGQLDRTTDPAGH